MNKEYIYIDGKVIISNESGKQKPVEYYDNLDEVLVQENVIETMENRITELEKYSQLYKKNKKKHYIPFYVIFALFMSTFGVNLLLSFFKGGANLLLSFFKEDTNPLMTSVDSKIDTINSRVLVSSIFSVIPLSFGAVCEFLEYSQHKKSLKKERGVNSELEFLKKQIVKEKQILEDLKKVKKRDEEVKEFRTVEVDDKQQLQALKSYLNLYFDLGYNEKKYFRYFQQGKLDEKLRKYYADSYIEVAKEYLEEKGPTLVKRRKIK